MDCIVEVPTGSKDPGPRDTAPSHRWPAAGRAPLPPGFGSRRPAGHLPHK